MTIRHILSTKEKDNVLTISAGETVREAISQLGVHKIGELVVSEDGKSADGIISERDIIRELGQQGVECLSLRVGEIMTKDLVHCSRDDTAEHALQTMTDGRFRHLPVVEDGALVGLISIGDVVKARLNQMESENQAMISMIAGN